MKLHSRILLCTLGVCMVLIAGQHSAASPTTSSPHASNLGARDTIPPLYSEAENGGTVEVRGVGLSFDANAFRGQVLNSSAGTITKICVLLDGTGTTLTLAVKTSTTAGAVSFSEGFASLVGGWNCKIVEHAWSSSSLFIYKSAGTAAIGWVSRPGGQSYYSQDNGASWNGDGYHRAFRLETTGGDLEDSLLPGWYDRESYRGKYFDPVPVGTIKQICVYGLATGSTLTVGISAKPDGFAPQVIDSMTLTVTEGWSCHAVSYAWNFTTLFIYKISGTADIAYDGRSPTDSRYSTNQGTTWSTDLSRRAMRVVFDDGTAEYVENGGDANSESSINRGQYFEDTPRGTLDGVCVWSPSVAGTVNLGLRVTPSGSDLTTATVVVTHANAWNCLSLTATTDWPHESIFVYKSGGTASIGSENSGPYDGYALVSGSWVAQSLNFGLRVHIQIAQYSDVNNGGEGTTFDSATYWGKYNSLTSIGTITRVCAFGQNANTNLTLAFKPSVDSSQPTATNSFTLAAGSAWTCRAVEYAWSDTIFLYKTDGSASIGYDTSSPYDTYHSTNGGSTWTTLNYRTGFKYLMR